MIGRSRSIETEVRWQTLGPLGWAVVVGISAGLIRSRLEFAPVFVPFALALLAGVAKSGTT